jgi:hypothetical protein
LGDYDPAVSPDGKQMVFVRQLGYFDADLFAVELRDGKASGALRRITNDHRVKR